FRGAAASVGASSYDDPVIRPLLCPATGRTGSRAAARGVSDAGGIHRSRDRRRGGVAVRRGEFRGARVAPARRGGTGRRGARAGVDLPAGVDATATQRAVFEISRATHEAPTLEALFERIHGIVERLIGAKNFYIALADEAEQMMRFPYTRDEFAPPRDRRFGL